MTTHRPLLDETEQYPMHTYGKTVALCMTMACVLSAPARNDGALLAQHNCHQSPPTIDIHGSSWLPNSGVSVTIEGYYCWNAQSFGAKNFRIKNLGTETVVISWIEYNPSSAEYRPSYSCDGIKQAFALDEYTATIGPQESFDPNTLVGYQSNVPPGETLGICFTKARVSRRGR